MGTSPLSASRSYCLYSVISQVAIDLTGGHGYYICRAGRRLSPAAMRRVSNLEQPETLDIAHLGLVGSYTFVTIYGLVNCSTELGWKIFGAPNVKFSNSLSPSPPPEKEGEKNYYLVFVRFKLLPSLALDYILNIRTIDVFVQKVIQP